MPRHKFTKAEASLAGKQGQLAYAQSPKRFTKRPKPYGRWYFRLGNLRLGTLIAPACVTYGPYLTKAGALSAKRSLLSYDSGLFCVGYKPYNEAA